MCSCADLPNLFSFHFFSFRIQTATSAGQDNFWIQCPNSARTQKVFLYKSIPRPFPFLVTPVAGSIFRPRSLTQKSGSEFSDEILRSALPDIQPTFKCPVEWIHVIPPPRLDWMKMD